MVFGTLKPALAGISDIGFREAVIFAPLVILTILFGVAPKPVLDMSAASVAQLLDGYNKAIKTAEQPPLPAPRADVAPLVIPVSAVR
jgi:NADH-quinone oxidoreductase subunit M